MVEWRPFELIEKVTNSSASTLQYAIILLNQPVVNQQYFQRLWDNASLRILVDGGGNRWNDVRKNFPSILFPHIVCGDFDSINPEVLAFLKQQEDIDIIETPNQDETDFTKAIRILQNKFTNCLDQEITKVIAYCETTGRFDQIMANVETLFHSLKILPTTQLYLMGSSSMTWLLAPGSHKITCGKLVVPYCSLIPIGSSSILTTTGLKWNLTNDTLAFGHLVSTSNEIDKGDNDYQIVTINTSEPILWSMELVFAGY